MRSEAVLSEAVGPRHHDSKTSLSSSPCFESNVRQIDPLADPRWERFVERHPRSSVFHSVPWLRALRETYGFRPFAFTTSSPHQELTNGAPFCEIASWLTGTRIVSLPFSDYCEILYEKESDLKPILGRLHEEAESKRWRYVEIRPVTHAQVLGQPFVRFTLHRVDLTPDLATLFANLHHSSIQRKILRAEREQLEYVEGADRMLLDSFYGLLAVTRRRHGVPPQPQAWFRALVRHFGQNLKIRLAFKNGMPVAGIVTIRHKDTLYYKYGGSDAHFHRLGGMHLLYWRAIQDAKNSGLKVFDLGRSDLDQPGLMKFKSRWGSKVSELAYVRKPSRERVAHLFESGGSSSRMRLVRSVFARTPVSILSAFGDLLYKHVG